MRGGIWRFYLSFALLGAVATLAQSPAADPAFVVRGRRTEVTQRTFRARLERFHDALADTLRRVAPELLPQLDPPPAPAVTGYQLLPRLVPDAPSQPPTKPQLTSYYWGWSDTLYERQTTALALLEADLASMTARAGAAPASGARVATRGSGPPQAVGRLIEAYRTIAAARGAIDADVGYNWFWQREIANNRARFDARTRLIDHALALTAKDAPLSADIRSASAPQDTPSFVRVESPTRHLHVVTVPLITDISDDAFVERFTAAIEAHWTLAAGGDVYRVRLDITRMTPHSLYCGPTAGAPQAVPCTAPAHGDSIDLATHVARFPPGRAVLTTGARALHVAERRAIVLTPFDVTPRVLAHEFGHVLGFPDAYLRGYRDLGDDGFRVIEYVPDQSNIMAAPGAGSVREHHFRQLIAARAAAR